ncbi:S8 family serine peptidase [Candidatus Enterococcus ikei]|uniref:S8 family serine peptidase n=1 Tax=Candidatus Enterococcus ikei TaxID=2815326 RepID=A0ABS3GUC4_9ENTE|nr:S8 family serine peptidase [Enterococcus sp. DIV0869a]MBO0438857.1 S8 family serine peptidase [Enterococcus sp. DIV0869a]
MEKFGYTRKRKRNSIFLLSVLLLSTGFSTFSTIAWGEKVALPQDTNYQKLLEAHQKNESSINERSKKAFEENVKAQLASRGFDISQFNENAFDDNQEIRLIVQLKKDAAVEKLAAPTGTRASIQSIEQATDSVVESQATIKKKIETLTGNKSNRAFGYLINGFSIEAKYKDVETIKSISGVESVSAAKVYYPTSIDANQLANVQQVWQNHQLKGEGMVVSIIDSGVDPTHKDLRLSDSTKEKISLQVGEQGAKNIGYGQAFTRKIPYGHNYADNNEDIVDTNPGTSMHGMHVAGIVAANGIGDDPAKAVLGVAPEAQLLAMKVFPNNTRVATALDDDVIAAIEDSVKLGADVLNMSLGSVSGTVDPDSPEQLVIKQAAEAGVLSVISAGNSSLSTTDNTSVDPQNKLGTLDTGTLGSPGITTEALTVASAENTYITSEGLLVQLIDADGTKHIHKMETSTSPSGAIVFSNATTADTHLLNQPTDVIDVGIGADSDYQNKEVKGKVVLIQRGIITFSDKQRIAKEHGASAALIYNNTPNSPPLNMQLDDSNYLTLSLTKEDGDALVKLANETKNQQFSFDINSYQFANPKQGKMSDFSSWGLTPDLEFKPEISAPGGNIYSTVNDNGYQTKSGTSMSAPFVAGSQALVYQALKKEKTSLTGTDLTRFAKLSVMNTALPMLDKNHDDVIISPRRQGAGQIKVDKAIENTTSLTDSTDGDGALALKQIGKSTTISVKLQNNGKEALTYRFTDFGGVYTEAQTSTAEVYETKIKDAKITANQEKITIQPSETKTVQLQLELPDSFSKQQFVEGYIGFISDKEPDLTMPFVGFYGDYSLAPVIDAPIYDAASIQGAGFFTDNNNTFLGLKDNTIDPELVAISPNQDNRKDEAKPTLNFLRNAKNVTYEIVDENKKVIRRLAEEKQIRKDTFNSRAGRFSSHTVTTANWDGTVYNLKTGGNEVVSDGQYQLKVVAKADIADAKPQEMYLPIKVDTVAPTIEQITFDDNSSTAALNMKLTDQLSGVDLRSVIVSVNGKIETYDLSNQKAEAVSIPLRDSQKPSAGQNQVEVLITDHAGNYGYQNQYIQYGTKAGLVLFNLTDDQVITSNTTHFSTEDQTLTINGSYPQELFVNGTKATTDEQLFTVAVPLTNETKTIIFSNDSEGKSIIKEVPVTVYSKKPELSILNPSQENSTTDQMTYTLTGTTGATTKKLELEQASSSEKVDLTSLIQSDGQFQTALQLVHGQNLISIRATDEHGNQTVQKRILTTTGYHQTDILALENINVSGITSVGVGNPDYDSTTGTYTIKGRLREKVDQFTINKQEVSYDPTTLTFSFPIKLKQGKHSLAFYIQANQENNGKPLVNEGYYVIVDTVLPTLQMEHLNVDDNGSYSVYTNENPFHLKGLISDNFSGYKLFVNNENIHTDINYDIFDEKFFEGKPAAAFDYEVPVTDGENHLQVGLTDSTGNTTSKNITVFYKNETPRAPTVTANTTALTNQAVTLKAVAEDQATIFYSFDGEQYELYTDEISVVANQKVYFNAIDRYGNKSDVTTYEVTNIQNEIAAKPIINVTSKTRTLSFTPPVQVAITYEKELTKEQESYTHLRYSLDKGKTYQVYSAPFEQKTATEVWAQSYDDAGNESEIVKTVIKFAEQEKPTTPIEEAKPDKPATENSTSTEQSDKEQTQQKASSQASQAMTQRPANNSLKSDSKSYQAKKQRNALPQTGENKNNLLIITGIIFIFMVSGYQVRRKIKEDCQ